MNCSSRPGKYVIEVAGPAGSGKSTLCEQLYEKRESFVRGRRLQPYQLVDWPFFIVNGFKSLPRLMSRSGADRRLSRDEIKKMIVLKGWNKILARQAQGSSQAILVDQGPIFSLATLHGFGPQRLREPSFLCWWDEMFHLWSSALSLIVRLDAPNDVLLGRIQYRSKSHDMKIASRQSASEYLNTYRSSFSYVLSELDRRRSLPVLEFDTSMHSADSIVDRLLAWSSSTETKACDAHPVTFAGTV